MKRRDFIKAAALGAAAAGLPQQYMWAGSEKNGRINCFQRPANIPVIQDVDVLVVGGSSGGVAAAESAAQQGASAFLVTGEPYLGEDICATYRLHQVGPLSTDLAKALFPEESVTPMHIKRTLDETLIRNQIDFYFSTFCTDLLVDAQGRLAGAVIANRTGYQAVHAKTVIDATAYASVARLAGAGFTPFQPGPRPFKFTVIGTPQPELEAQSYPVPLDTQEPVEALEYSLNIDMPDDSPRSWAAAEQRARDVTWNPDQRGSADRLFFIPKESVKSIESSQKSLRECPVTAFQPEGMEQLYVLSPYADISRQAASDLSMPGFLIETGQRIGKAAAEHSAVLSVSEPVAVKPDPAGPSNYQLKITFDMIRPGRIRAELEARETDLPVWGEYDTVVVGGGVAGAPAGIAAARSGARTLVTEYQSGLGGQSTLGYIASYYHGYRKGFTHEIDLGVKDIGGKNPRKREKLKDWVVDWKMEWYRRELLKSGADIWFHTLGIGALVEDNKVRGVILATPFGRGVVLARNVIDSTGSADIAIAAGAEYRYTDGESVAIQGAGLPPRVPDRDYVNTDWTFINDSDVEDMRRVFVAARHKFRDFYDVGTLLQTRERRRILGEYDVSVLDVYNSRTYPDTISIHKSSFDTHGYTVDPFFSLRPPEGSGIDVIAYVPLRSLIPRGLKHIAVTGLGASAHRDAMPVIRMQPCLQNQGYAVGLASAMAVKNDQAIGDIDIKSLQKKLVEMENLPESVLDYENPYPPSDAALETAVKSVVNDLEGLEILLWDTDRSLPLLRQAMHNSDDKEHQAVYAHILALYGDHDGWMHLAEKIKSIKSWDEGWNYTGMGQFGASRSHLDSLITALGASGESAALPVILEKASLLDETMALSHFYAVSEALKNYKHPDSRAQLMRLLNLPGVTGHAVTTIEKAKQIVDDDWTQTDTRNRSLRELFLARALYLCGDADGLGEKILEQYARDLRGHYARHACGLLYA